MNAHPLPAEAKHRIILLQTEIDDLRNRLGVEQRGSVIFQADASYADEERIIVEADGLGVAVLKVVEGNYPLDFLTREESKYSTEASAVEAAEALLSYADAAGMSAA